MRFILLSLQILLLRAEILLHHFATAQNISAIYQLPNGSIVLGTNEGRLMVYHVNGSFINKCEGPHKNTINSIAFFQFNQTQFIVASEQKGLISVWRKNGGLDQLIQKQDEIVEMKVEQNLQKTILVISTKYTVYIHQIPSLKLVRSIQIPGNQFKIMQVVGNRLYLLVQKVLGNSIYVYDIETDRLSLIVSRQSSLIIDFSVSGSSNGIYIFLVNALNHLEIYHLDNGHQIIDYVDTSTNNPSAFKYSSIISFNNNDQLPLFVALKVNNLLQFYQGFDVTLFLQINTNAKLMISNCNRHLLLASANGQVTSLTVLERAQEQGIDIWIVFLILFLLALGLYICCGDCCPGVIQKWRRQKERNEIELQLYRQRTQLQNF